MRIYLDACCVNRLTDDQSQVRIREESEAIEYVLRTVRQGKSLWLISDVLIEEIERNPQLERRRENRALLAWSSDTIQLGEGILKRAQELEKLGYGAFDATHLASAEAGRADVLLTTDNKFLRRAARGEGNPLVPVRNPILWLEEVSI